MQLAEYQQKKEEEQRAQPDGERSEEEHALEVEIEREVRVLQALRLQYQQMCAAHTRDDQAVTREGPDECSSGDDSGDEGSSSGNDEVSADGREGSLWQNALWLVSEGVKSHAELIDLVISAPATLLGLASESDTEDEDEDEDEDEGEDEDEDGASAGAGGGHVGQNIMLAGQRVDVKVVHEEEEEKTERRY
jgi:hypothetical protein